jgi:hypothetical protein
MSKKANNKANNSKYQFNGRVGSVIPKMTGGTITNNLNNHLPQNSTKSKLLWTGVVIVCGIGIAYLINRLPDWGKIEFLGQHFKIILGIGMFALTQALVTWKNS